MTTPTFQDGELVFLTRRSPPPFSVANFGTVPFGECADWREVCDGCDPPPPVCCEPWPCLNPQFGFAPGQSPTLRVQMTVSGIEPRPDCAPNCPACDGVGQQIGNTGLNGTYQLFVPLKNPCGGQAPTGSDTWTECDWIAFYRGVSGYAECPPGAEFRNVLCDGEGRVIGFTPQPCDDAYTFGPDVVMQYQFFELTGPIPQSFYDATPDGYVPILGYVFIARLHWGDNVAAPNPASRFHTLGVQLPVFYPPGLFYRAPPQSGLCESQIPALGVSQSTSVHVFSSAAQVEHPHVPGLFYPRGIEWSNNWCRLFPDDANCVPDYTQPALHNGRVDLQVQVI